MYPAEIELNFVNNTEDGKNRTVVIFQQNLEIRAGARSAAWLVLDSREEGDAQPFTFPLRLTLSVKDSYGNYSPRQDAGRDHVFEMVKDPSGHVLRAANAPAADPGTMELKNRLTSDISGMIHRGDRLLAIKPVLPPGQSVAFRFDNRIKIGVAPRVSQSDILDPTLAANIKIELDLTDIESADIIMTGGPDAANIQFHLDNVIPADPSRSV